MEEGKRQKQIGGLIQEELNKIFQRFGLNMIDGGMVSISSVKITPDLLEAWVYLSFFQVADAGAALKKIQEKSRRDQKRFGKPCTATVAPNSGSKIFQGRYTGSCVQNGGNF